MRNRAKSLVVITLSLLGMGVFGYGIAEAQQGGAQPAAPTGDNAVALQKPVNLSLEEMTKQSDATVARIDMTATGVRKMLEQARTERDVIKTLCLNDKLTQLDVTLRSAKERQGALQGAVTRRDQELASHEFQIMQVYRGRADRLSSEAQLCIGNELVIAGQTSVTTSIDRGIPDDLVGPPGTPQVPYPNVPPVPPPGSPDL